MRSYAIIMTCAALFGCASVSGTQSFATVQEYSLPSVGTVIPARTVSAQGAATTRSFAQAVLDSVDQLRKNDHVDSADVTIHIVSSALSSNTNFSGVKALRTELVTGSSTIRLCDHVLSASEQQSSSITCPVDHEIQESELRTTSAANTQAQVRIEVDMEGTVTATKLRSTLNFEAELNADLSL